MGLGGSYRGFSIFVMGVERSSVFPTVNYILGARIAQWYSAGLIGGSSPGRGWEFFSSTPRPDLLWGLPSLLLSAYQRLFPWG